MGSAVPKAEGREKTFRAFFLDGFIYFCKHVSIRTKYSLLWRYCYGYRRRLFISELPRLPAFGLSLST